MDRHETVSTRSEYYSPGAPGSIPTGGKLFAEFMNDPARILVGFCRKTRLIIETCKETRTPIDVWFTV